MFGTLFIISAEVEFPPTIILLLVLFTFQGGLAGTIFADIEKNIENKTLNEKATNIQKIIRGRQVRAQQAYQLSIDQNTYTNTVRT